MLLRCFTRSVFWRKVSYMCIFLSFFRERFVWCTVINQFTDYQLINEFGILRIDPVGYLRVSLSSVSMYFQTWDMVIHWYITSKYAVTCQKKKESLCNSLSQRSLLKSRFELGTFKDRIGTFNVVEPWHTNRVMYRIKFYLLLTAGHLLSVHCIVVGRGDRCWGYLVNFIFSLFQLDGVRTSSQDLEMKEEQNTKLSISYIQSGLLWEVSWRV